MNCTTGCTRKCCFRQALKRTFSRAVILPLSDVGLRERSLAPRIHVDQAMASLKTLIRYKGKKSSRMDLFHVDVSLKIGKPRQSVWDQ